MPYQKSIGMEMKKALDLLEDYTLSTHMLRNQNYYTIQNALSNGEQISEIDVKRILEVCVHDLKEDKKFTVNVMKVINLILKKIKAGELTHYPDLLPSALAIMDTFLVAARNNVTNLQFFCFDTFVAYPDNVYGQLGSEHSDKVLELLKLASCHKLPSDSLIQFLNFIHKLLKILPPDKKSTFVKKGMDIWFSVLLPQIMSLLVNHQFKLPIELLELLTDAVIPFDYFENSFWQKNILESICKADKYPSIMKSELEKGSDIWHRLWIVFIRLLKDQSTVNNRKLGSPINSMLPVVEMAFKMDIANRCRAFQCWNALIDNFSSEMNEYYVNRRIKLLLIPLRSNNARVEETAQAKFGTWWHLIKCYQTNIDKLADTVLVPFLHFCFDKPVIPDKPVVVPGLLSINMKKQCAQALVELTGHVECVGCVSLPKLKGKVINGNFLTNHWADFGHSVHTALKLCLDNELTTQQVQCLWKSILQDVVEMPECSDKENLLSKIMELLDLLLKECQSNNKLADIFFNILINTMLCKEKVIPILKKVNIEDSPLHNILKMILNPALYPFYDSSQAEDSVKKLKPLTNIFVQQQNNSSNNDLESIVKELPVNDNSLMIWTALAESIVEWQYICDNVIHMVLIWPLIHMDKFQNDKLSALTWYTLYNLVYPQICNTAASKEIRKVLLNNGNSIFQPLHYFLIYPLIGVIKHKINHKCTNCEKEVQSLLNVVKKGDLKTLNTMLPEMTEAILLLMTKITVNVNLTLATNTVSILNIVVRLITDIVKSNSSDNSHMLIMMENLLDAIYLLFKSEAYYELKLIIVDELVKHLQLFHKYSFLKYKVLSIMKLILPKNKDTTLPLFVKINAAINTLETGIQVKLTGKSLIEEKYLDKNNFSTPDKKSSKRGSKKEPSIVNTVVEQGEEYVVVNSNWKFNPKMLTENQKEKFSRKREDIPALYQDLSQSQDEFKLKSWKQDSQNSSSTNSKSNSKSRDADLTDVLKDNSDVIPTIISNILPDGTTKVYDAQAKSDTSSAKAEVLPISKDPKTRRMTLKDRVFRNLNSLVHQTDTKILSDAQNQSVSVSVNSDIAKKHDLDKSLHEVHNQTISENVLKTPITAKSNDNVVNSAPSNIIADRPSRIKRAPKKFDDSQLIALKRKRNRISQSDYGTKCEMPFEFEASMPKESADIQRDDIQIFDKTENLDEQSATVVIIDSENDHINSKDPELTNAESDKNTSVLCSDQNNELIVSDVNLDILEQNRNFYDNINPTAEGGNVENMGNPSHKPEQLSKPKAVHTTETKVSDSKSKDPARKKRSRIEKELAIDMVEGHPFLQSQSEKRVRRKRLTDTLNSSRRKSSSQKFKQTKLEITPDIKSGQKSIEPNVELLKNFKKNTLAKPYEQNSHPLDRLCSSDDIPSSEDVIESSQDSSLTSISVKSSKSSKKVPIVTLVNIELPKNTSNFSRTLETVSLVNQTNFDLDKTSVDKDIEFSIYKTIDQNTEQDQLTENMDTEPISEQQFSISDDVTILNNKADKPIIISSNETCSEVVIQSTAEADTQSMDPTKFEDMESYEEQSVNNNNIITSKEDVKCNMESSFNTVNIQSHPELVNVELIENEGTNDTSPLIDKVQRQKDFLNDTSEISPIKTLSPIDNNRTPSPETSRDYVVIKLTSPVQSNGEPLDNFSDSPEVFTEDKVSPDKRDQSPPRVEISFTNTSPTSSLSLKKNRPQVLASGRAAQMLGLCLPDRQPTIINTEKPVELEEPKKSCILSTPARRNLRMLYSTVNENNENSDDGEDSENFLKFKRLLPTSDCSPSGPILKRKLAEIIDDTSMSPASKRKRVSFHDPPVSTTVAVQKYIEPSGIRSPQSSTLKRLEKPSRPHANMKSPKRLDSVFKLENILTKAVESFIDTEMPDETELSSLEQTPIVEIIKTSDLNDCDPICLELIDCDDPIDNIAAELSSPAMRSLLIKELQGKIETIGDLAKMTELNVNRLCIKAPKVKVAKKVLTEYAAKKKLQIGENNKTDKDVKRMEEEIVCTPVVNAETQTVVMHVVTAMETQTEALPILHTAVQTKETGEKSTLEIIEACLANKPDFLDCLCEKLEKRSKQKIAEGLPFESTLNLLINNITPVNTNIVLTGLFKQQKESGNNIDLQDIQQILCDSFDTKSLILFCSQLLQKIHDKPA